MNRRLGKLVAYICGGKKAEFADRMGWSPQYLNRLLSDSGSMGLRPVITLLERIPGLNARWLLLGEGQMMADATAGVRDKLLRILDLERYIPVMTKEEVRMLADGRTDFPADTVARWRTALEIRKEEIDSRFREAYKRQEELCRQRTVN